MALYLWLIRAHRHALKGREAGALSADRSGVAAIEFALVAPIFIALLMGIMSYGSYFLTAHTIQQIANDSARASIAGMDDAERKTLVASTVDAASASYPFLKGKIQGVDVSRSGSTVSVRITYDGSKDIWTKLMVPAPSMIVRDAAIRLGGY